MSRRRSSRTRRPRPHAVERIVTWLACGASGVGVALSGAHPTANHASDLVVCFLFGAAVAMAASIARTWSWVFGAGIVAATTNIQWSLVALVCVGASILIASFPNLPGRRALGALVGAGVLQGALRIDIDRFGLSALLTVATVAPMLVSGWRLARSKTRKRLVNIGSGVGAFVGVIVVLFAMALLRGRSSVEVGITRAKDGLVAARQGDTTTASSLLQRASQQFSDAHSAFGGWMGKPAFLVPFLGQQARALSLVSESGATVAATAADAATHANVQSLEVVNGALDLAQVAQMQAPLAQVVTALDAAVASNVRAQSHWLISPVAKRVDAYTQSVSDAAQESTTASDAVKLLPALLGGTGVRHYVIVFGTPAESRELGGFSGAFGELIASNGKISLNGTVQASALNDLAGHRTVKTLPDQSKFPPRYMSYAPYIFFQNIDAAPDFPTISEVVKELWPQVGGDPVDGVLYMDPATLAALLKLSGPVKVNGIQLTSANASDFLLKQQYIQFAVNDDRHDFLAEASRQVFNKLTSSHLPGPKKIADTLAPSAHERRLLAYSFHPDEEALFKRLQIDGALPPVGGADFLSVRSSQAGLSKIDAYLSRSIDYHAAVDPSSGVVRSTVSVTLHNGAPASGLPDYVLDNHKGLPLGTNYQNLTIYTPLDLTDVTVNGKSIPRAAGMEYGRNAYDVLVQVPAASDLTVVFTLAGAIEPTSHYRLLVVPQPLATPDSLKVEVVGADGFKARSGESVASRPFSTDSTFNVVIRRK